MHSDQLITALLPGPDPRTAPRRKGLLLVPEFPADSFWSYRHIVRWTGKRAVFPPLGLLTFAAYMPPNWEFELVDLNTESVSARALRRKIGEADAVFTGAMSIQKPSLVQLLSGVAKGMDTPWVLGGPYPSSYRNQILDPQTESDRILHDGLDFMVWGEAYNWISTIDAVLADRPRHKPGELRLMIPEAVANAPPGSRKYLLDQSIFGTLADVASPRWDLIDMSKYLRSMAQTTAGCPFRCDFCDIIEFNGGFSRPKSLAGVVKDLQAIYDTGYRGGVFTVDDNFIGEPKAISVILDVMTEFQRKHGYPFTFATQASVNLGTPDLEYLMGKMRRAGFEAVFFGIENPDPEALKCMNKKQNNKVDIPDTVRRMQAQGIEVYAGFILGGDHDTTGTAKELERFIKQTSIFTAMPGLLTPVPHTPLHRRLELEGRLLPAEFTGNNTDDEIQFHPSKMTIPELRAGIHDLLHSLFTASETYRRARDVLDRVTPHAFGSSDLAPGYLQAALISIWKQGITRADPEYFKLLVHAAALDVQRYRTLRAERQQTLATQATYGARDPVVLVAPELPNAHTTIERAHEYLIRHVPDLSLQRVADFINSAREHLQQGEIPGSTFRRIYGAAGELLKQEMHRHRFPGQYLKRGFELAVRGAHYQQVMRSITARA